MRRVAIFGGGPAGLMVAGKPCEVAVFDAMSSVGRKLPVGKQV